MLRTETSTPGAVEHRRRGGTGAEGLPPLHRRYPTIADLRKRARRRVPRFAFDFVDGGCGENETRDSNRVALDAVKLVARYGLGVGGVNTELELFGRRYAAPIGISPMGMGGLLWPRAEFQIQIVRSADLRLQRVLQEDLRVLLEIAQDQ